MIKNMIIMVFLIGLCANNAYTMEQKQITLITNDGKKHIWNEHEALLFGTIKALREDVEENEPIPLMHVSGHALKIIKDDMDWVLKIHACYPDKLDRILNMPAKERNRQAKSYANMQRIPNYSSETLNTIVGCLNAAIYLNATEWQHKYAALAANLCVSDDSLSDLYASTAEHPMIKHSNHISDDIKGMIRGYMEERWIDRLKIQHKDLVGVTVLSPDESMEVTACEKMTKVTLVATGETSEIEVTTQKCGSSIFSDDMRTEVRILNDGTVTIAEKDTFDQALLMHLLKKHSEDCELLIRRQNTLRSGQKIQRSGWIQETLNTCPNILELENTYSKILGPIAGENSKQ